MERTKSLGSLSRVTISSEVLVTHIQFVDDFFLLGDGSRKDMQAIKQVLDLFCKATGMVINVQKYCTLNNVMNPYGTSLMISYLTY